MSQFCLIELQIGICRCDDPLRRYAPAPPKGEPRRPRRRAIALPPLLRGGAPKGRRGSSPYPTNPHSPICRIDHRSDTKRAVRGSRPPAALFSGHSIFSAAPPACPPAPDSCRAARGSRHRRSWNTSTWPPAASRRRRRPSPWDDNRSSSFRRTRCTV